ncbi:unnamed protein product [Brassica oleracea]
MAEGCRSRSREISETSRLNLGTCCRRTSPSRQDYVSVAVFYLNSWRKSDMFFKLTEPLYVNQILLQTTHILESLPTLVDIHVDNGQCVIVCGDIHGQFYDLCNIFDKKGFPSQDKQYLFNSDFVDRGSFSVETIFTLFALKCACPLWIHLARGNHESRSLNKKEVLAKLNETVMDMFSDTFCCLPLAHALNRKNIVLHGGLFSRDGVTLSDIKSIQRFCQPPKRGLMRDLLWSDPQDSPGRSESTRGEGIIFFW